MIRPVTTNFSKKNDDDLLKADLNDVDKYLDYYYEEDFELKLKGARMIFYLSIDPTKMVQLANENLFNILSRSLKEDHKKNPEFLIHSLGFFYGYSNYETFHEILESYGVSEACLAVINFQYAKYIVRKEDLQQKFNDNIVDFPKELDRFIFMIKKQDRILRLALSILLNLAENQNIEKTLVKKDIVSWLQKYSERSNINLLVIILLFIKKLCVYDVNKDNMIKNNLIHQLSGLFNYMHQLIVSLTLDIIYNLIVLLYFLVL